jgi:uncharacterized protein YndB with AHSA1/START domain
VTDRSVAHATFTVERTYDASPARVFAAWADPTAKARWFASPEEWGPDERIVYTYSMHLDQTLLSISVATVEFRGEGAGTRLVLTEQGAYLDARDSADQRAYGVGELLDALGAELRREPAGNR